jgi:hypothetical protein
VGCQYTSILRNPPPTEETYIQARLQAIDGTIQHLNAVALGCTAINIELLSTSCCSQLAKSIVVTDHRLYRRANNVMLGLRLGLGLFEVVKKLVLGGQPTVGAALRVATLT